MVSVVLAKAFPNLGQSIQYCLALISGRGIYGRSLSAQSCVLDALCSDLSPEARTLDISSRSIQRGSIWALLDILSRVAMSSATSAIQFSIDWPELYSFWSSSLRLDTTLYVSQSSSPINSALVGLESFLSGLGLHGPGRSSFGRSTQH